MVDKGFVLVRLGRQGEFQHHLLVTAQRVELLDDLGKEDVFGLGLVGDRDGHFRLDDRHQAVAQDLAADIELLRHDGGDAFRIGGMDDRAHLGAEDALGNGALKQMVEIRHRLHHLDVIGFVGEALVDFQEGNNLVFVPEIFSGRRAVDFAVHGALEQDRADDFLAIEGGGLDDAGAHLVDQAEHFLVIGIGVFIHAIEAEGFRRGAAGLVKRGNEAILLGNLPGHLWIGHDFTGESLACVEFANFAFKYRACQSGQPDSGDCNGPASIRPIRRRYGGFRGGKVPKLCTIQGLKSISPDASNFSDAPQQRDENVVILLALRDMPQAVSKEIRP